MNLVRKNAARASSATIKRELAEKIAKRDEKLARLAEIERDLPSLSVADDLTEFQNSRTAQDAINVSLIADNRTIDRLEAGIKEAEAREERDERIAIVTAQKRKSDKLYRGMGDRFHAAANAFATVLRELEEDHQAWTRLNEVIRDGQQSNPADGITTGASVYQRLLSDFAPNHTRLRMPIADAMIVGLSSNIIFRGKNVV